MHSQVAALNFGLGRSLAATLPRHRVQETVDCLGRAFDYYFESGDFNRSVSVAECPIPTLSGLSTGVADRIRRALTIVPRNSLAEGRLLSRYGLELGRYGVNYQGAQEAFGQALVIAQNEADLRLEMRVLAASANVDFYHLMFERSWEQSRRVIEMAQSLDDPYTELSVRHDAARTLTHIGESRLARDHAAAALGLAEKLRHRYWLLNVLRINSTLLRLSGEQAPARELSERALQLDPGAATSVGELVLLEYETGDFAQVEARLEQLLEVMRRTGPRPGPEYTLPAIFIPLITRSTGSLDRLGTAEAAANIVLNSPIVTPIFAKLAKTSLALVAVCREEFHKAKECYNALKSPQPTVLWAICQDRLLGLLAKTMGDMEQACEHFEGALAFCRKAGYRPELAWTCCDHADTLLQRDNPGDREKAMSLLDESLSISSELGMRPLMERVLSRRDILKA